MVKGKLSYSSHLVGPQINYDIINKESKSVPRSSKQRDNFVKNDKNNINPPLLPRSLIGDENMYYEGETISIPRDIERMKQKIRRRIKYRSYL